MKPSEIASYTRPCGRAGCFQIGKWLPVLSIRLVGQTVAEQPVTCGIPMFLCEKHKAEFNPHDAMTIKGKMKLSVMVALKRRKKLNWDTIEVEWRTEQDAHRVIAVDEAGRH
jgi:hypothetical protein